jgi:hypothetical protein
MGTQQQAARLLMMPVQGDWQFLPRWLRRPHRSKFGLADIGQVPQPIELLARGSLQLASRQCYWSACP